MDFEELMNEVESAVADQPTKKHVVATRGTKEPPTTSSKTAPLPPASTSRNQSHVAKGNKSDIDDLLNDMTIDDERATSRRPVVATARGTKPATASSSTGGSKRCTSVYLAGTQMKHGVYTSAVNAQACSNLRCNECDFLVVQFDNKKWHSSVDYMFFRENVPNEARLRVKMDSDVGSTAYACQCKWINAQVKTTPEALQLKWACAGH
ncbi:Aste57867_7975 [Aphanomyces stellatus]|uniref:Cilia- and flagella-associated protein 418 n=1 Tax=Aphanomyces stellatus TaxID=120398 RepID=A0A485KJ48_9STRA|nr:hypothetical protein As57867_007945 [Aphanomyces stellatus]VFT84868.1 Aste57867_7975 [Aphanomyces stellatus]